MYGNNHAGFHRIKTISNASKLLLITSFVFVIVVITLFPSKKIVYVYNDDGVSENSLQQTLSTFKKHLSNYKVQTINALEVIEGKWIKKAVLFIMPGGADLPYTKKLNGKGNAVIKNFVRNGGKYLGICAGAYYGTSYIEFDKKGELEVSGERELSFLKGKAVGPALAKYDYKNNSGARPAKIKLKTTEEIISYFNGGCFFETNQLNVIVLGLYSEINKPAVIYMRYGKGDVVLSGVHLEYNPILMDKSDPYLKEIIPQINHDILLNIVLNQLQLSNS
jgi:glutamine amidotransferase-like uncharacterized protein